MHIALSNTAANLVTAAVYVCEVVDQRRRSYTAQRLIGAFAKLLLPSSHVPFHDLHMFALCTVSHRRVADVAVTGHRPILLCS